MYDQGALACAVTLPDEGLEPNVIQTYVLSRIGSKGEYDGVDHSLVLVFAYTVHLILEICQGKAMEVLAVPSILVKWSRDVFSRVILQVKNCTIGVECYHKSPMSCMGHWIVLTISSLFVQHTPLAHYFEGITDYL